MFHDSYLQFRVPPTEVEANEIIKTKTSSSHTEEIRNSMNHKKHFQFITHEALLDYSF